MADRATANHHGGQSEDAGQGIRLPAQQNPQPEALGELLDEWAKEAGPPDPADVAAMRRRYFPQ